MSFYMFYQEILAVLMSVCISFKTRDKKLAKDSRCGQQFKSASLLNAQLLLVVQIGESYLRRLLIYCSIVKSSSATMQSLSIIGFINLIILTVKSFGLLPSIASV